MYPNRRKCTCKYAMPDKSVRQCKNTQKQRSVKLTTVFFTKYALAPEHHSAICTMICGSYSQLITNHHQLGIWISELLDSTQQQVCTRNFKQIIFAFHFKILPLLQFQIMPAKKVKGVRWKIASSIIAMYNSDPGGITYNLGLFIFLMYVFSLLMLSRSELRIDKNVINVANV